MRTVGAILLVVAASALPSIGSAQKVYKWTDANGRVIMQVASPFWRLWTFPFVAVTSGREVARVSKKWAGLLTEVLMDKDNFAVEFLEAELGENERTLVLAAAIYIDLQYFERKAGD